MTTKKSKEQLLLSFYAHQTEKSLHTDYNDAPEVHRPSFQYQAREDMSRPRNENKLPEIKPSPRDSSKAERIFNTSFVNDAMERNAIFT